MSELVPQFLLERIAEGRDRGEEPAAAVYVDIVGFTAMGDALARHGPPGAETLADVVQSVMIPIVDSVQGAGGFVAAFPGDAVLALFPATPSGSTQFQSGQFRAPFERRAVAAAEAMQGAIRAFGTRQTAYGAFDIAARVGVGAGELQWTVLRAPTGERRTYAFGGSAPARAVAAEGTAGPGEVVIHESARRPSLRLGQASRSAGVDLGALAHGFVAPDLVPDLGAGEFRPVTTAFIQIPVSDLDRVVADVFGLQDRHGGQLDPIELGDKGCVIRLVWGAPVRHEGDDLRALLFVDALRRRHQQIRVGVTTGIAFTGFVGSRARMGYITYGSHVNLAARLMSSATPGQVLSSGRLVDRARDWFALEPLGTYRLKGFSRPIDVQGVLAPRTADRSATEFVGRIGELAKLEEFLARTSGVAVVRGPPGIGKSSLVAEARRRVGGVRWIRAAADPVWRDALQPLRQVASQMLGQSAQTPRAVNERRFDENLSALGLEAHRAYLGALVDLFWPGSAYAQAEPGTRRRGVLDGVTALLRALCAQQPLVLQVDDLHWCDRETIAFLPELVDALSDRPFALVVTSRDDVQIGATRTLDLVLGELVGSDVAALGRLVLGEPLAPETVAWLADRTAGNPFFVEQVVLHLRERGRLLSSARGLALAEGGATVPPSVGAVVVARLDGLPTDLRRLVRCASVLGTRADVDELRGILVREPAPAPDVDQLTARAVELGLWRWSDGTVEFAHALVRDAAYDTLLLATRRRLHKAAVEAIEERNAGNLGPHLHRLAFHHAAAGVFDRARACERAAADRALGLGAYHEAGEYAQSGLSIGSAADGEELGLWLALAGSRMITEGQGAPGTKHAYDQAAALAGEAAETRAGFRALFGLRTFYLFQGDHQRSLALAARSLEIAQRIGAPDVLQQAHLMVGNAQFWVGELESAERHLQLVLQPSAAAGHDAHRAEFVQNPRFTAVFPAALGRWLRGDPADALRLAQSGLDEAVDAFSVATVLQVVGFLRCLDGDAEGALDAARRLVEIARENAYPVYVGIGSVQLGWAQARLGAVDSGLALMLDTQARMRAGGTRVASTLMAALVADAHLAAGRPDPGLAVAEEALADAVERRELAFAGLLARLRDDLRAARTCALTSTIPRTETTA